MHETVLLRQAVEALDVRADGVYVDGTFGRGGHSRAILARLGPAGRLLALDRDPQAVAAAGDIDDRRFTIRHARFSSLAEMLDDAGIAGIDGLLLDLGISSPQIDRPERGFSFQHDGPLDMRMDPGHGAPVSEWLANADENDIREVIERYGEERFARAIAKAIVARRQDPAAAPVASTGQLADLVAGVVRRRSQGAPVGKNAATRTFQALRILVNQELEELASVLSVACDRLAPQGRLVVISFHSLEDRIVKQFFAHESGRHPQRDPITGAPLPGQAARLRVLARVKPGADEVAGNARARSAVMRVAERVGAPS
ncbi:MAG: 16S rRNA (cytosine(1402)-N(4))-methyltransferase RsmH [Burkholderiaceae bacterium]